MPKPPQMPIPVGDGPAPSAPASPETVNALLGAILNMDPATKAKLMGAIQEQMTPAPGPDADGSVPLRTAPPKPTYKLYFLGTNPLIGLDADGQPVVTKKYHVTGRCHPPLEFCATQDDERPHAYVTRAFGEELRRADRAPMVVGSGDQAVSVAGPCRYEWSREALDAFAVLDAAKAQATA